MPIVDGVEVSLDWYQDSMRWMGEVLTGAAAHWCTDWDDLPIDETCMEYKCCGCFPNIKARLRVEFTWAARMRAVPGDLSG